MADIVSKKKALVKSNQTSSKRKSSFTKTSLQHQAVAAPTVTKTSVPGQRDRGRVIVFIGGDSDFVYVVNAIAAQGVRDEVVGLRLMTSSSLIDVANCYVDLANIQQTIQKFDDRADQPSVIFHG